MDKSMDKKVQAVIVMLMMLSLSFFIYIFMIPAQYIRSEQSNYGANITEVEGVVEHSGGVGVPLAIAGTIMAIILAVEGYARRRKKKAQEPSSIPEAEESVRNE